MRKWFIRVTAVCICAALADQAIWVCGTHALATGLDRWEVQARAQGWTISEGGRLVSGWPFAASLAVSDLRIAGGDHVVPGGVYWKTGRTTLSVSLAAPFTLAVVPEGQEIVRLSHLKTIVINADHVLAQVPLWRGETAQGLLVALGVTGGIAGSTHPQDVRLESLRLQLHARQDRGGGLQAELAFAVRGIGLPDIGRWPLGDMIAAGAGTVRLTSPDLRPAGDAHGEAAAWRDGGGSMSLQDMSLRWGPLVLHGQARLGLDGRLQPAGSGTADVGGGAAALDALADARVIAPGIGATGKALLSVMPAAPGGDGLRLPFVLRDNTLSLGPIPLARLSDVIW